MLYRICFIPKIVHKFHLNHYLSLLVSIILTLLRSNAPQPRWASPQGLWPVECIPRWQYTSFKFGPAKDLLVHLTILWSCDSPWEAHTSGIWYLRKRSLEQSVGQIERLALTYILCYVQNRLLVGSCCLTQWAHLDPLWWPRGVRRGGKLKCVYTHIHIHLYTHIYTYTYGWFTLLYARNQHNIVE